MKHFRLPGSHGGLKCYPALCHATRQIGHPNSLTPEDDRMSLLILAFMLRYENLPETYWLSTHFHSGIPATVQVSSRMFLDIVNMGGCKRVEKIESQNICYIEEE